MIRRRTLHLLFTVVLFLVGNLAIAGERREENVQYGSAWPYRIVWSDGDDAGIYRRDGKLIVPGNVLTNPITGSSIWQVPAVGTADGSYLAAAVVDGRVTFFTIYSDPNAPGTFAAVGSDQLPVIDIMSRMRILQIPEILDMRAVSFLPHGKFDGGTELVMISIAGATLFGSGMTLCVPINTPANAPIISSRGPGAVVEFAFHPQSEILHFYKSNYAQQVYSPLLGNDVAAKALTKVGKLAGFQKWTGELAAYGQNIASLTTSPSKERVPFLTFDAEKGPQLILATPPTHDATLFEEVIKTDKDPVFGPISTRMILRQTYDVVRDHAVVEIVENSSIKGSVPGLLRTTDSGEPYFVPTMQNRHNDRAWIFYVGNDEYFYIMTKVLALPPILLRSGKPPLPHDARIEFALHVDNIDITMSYQSSEGKFVEENVTVDTSDRTKPKVAEMRARREDAGRSWIVSKRDEAAAATKAPRANEMDFGKATPLLLEILERLANPHEAAEAILLIAPRSLTQKIVNYTVELWQGGGNELAPNWSHANVGLELLLGQNLYAQSDFIKAMREADPRRRGVVVMSGRTVIDNGKPDARYSRYEPIFLDNTAVSEEAGTSADTFLDYDDTTADNRKRAERMESPHQIWLLGMEGRPNVSQDDIARGDFAPTMSKLVVLSLEEWQKIRKDAPTEMKFGIERQFRQIFLPAPTAEGQKEMQAAFFEQEIYRGLRFDGSVISNVPPLPTEPGADPTERAAIAAQHRAMVLDYMASRIYAETAKKPNPLEALTSVFRNMAGRFKQQPDFLLDRSSVEEIVSEALGLPFDPSNLPEGHPDKVIARPQAYMLLQTEGGYFGALPQRQQLMGGMRARFAPSDRAMPSSAVIYGDSGSGKSRLTEALLEILARPMGLHWKDLLFDFNDPQNQRPECMAFYLNLGTVTTAELANYVGYWNHFFTLPRARYGIIILDDFHSGPEPVRAEFAGLVKKLMEQRGRTYRAQSPFTKAVVDILPSNLYMLWTQNIVARPGATMKVAPANATASDKVILDLVSSVEGSNIPVDPAFFKRFSEIIHVEKYLQDAKYVPLIAKLMEQSQAIVRRSKRIWLYIEPVIQAIVQAFPELNARDFFDGARNGIERVVETATFNGPEDGFGFAYYDRAKDAIPTYERVADMVAEQIDTITTAGFDGKLELIHLMANGARYLILEMMALELQRHPIFSRTGIQEEALLAPTLIGIRAGITEAPRIPVNVLRLDERALGAVSETAKTDFATAAAIIDGAEMAARPPALHFAHYIAGPFPMALAQSRRGGMAPAPTAYSVVAATTAKVNEIITGLVLEDHLALPRDVKEWPTADAWIRGLKESRDLPAALHSRVTTLIETLAEFQTNLVAVVPKAGPGSTIQYFSAYDATRLFIHILDRAIVQLPWPQIALQLSKGLTIAAEDLAIVQRLAVQELVWGDLALLRPHVPQGTLQMIGGASVFRYQRVWPKAMEEAAAQEFKAKLCNDLARGSGG